MGATVLLEHRLPDGSWHYDWMIERPEGGLATFRVTTRIDQPGGTAFRAERLADHRAAYLTYEGEVSGGRGWVRRLAVGEMAIEADTADRFITRGRIGGVAGRFVGAAREDGWWFEVLPDSG